MTYLGSYLHTWCDGCFFSLCAFELHLCLAIWRMMFRFFVDTLLLHLRVATSFDLAFSTTSLGL